MKLHIQNHCLNRESIKKTIVNNIVLTVFLVFFFVFTYDFQRSLRYFLLEHLVTLQILDTEPLVEEECLDHSIPHLITYIKKNNKKQIL